MAQSRGVFRSSPHPRRFSNACRRLFAFPLPLQPRRSSISQKTSQSPRAFFNLANGFALIEGPLVVHHFAHAIRVALRPVDAVPLRPASPGPCRGTLHFAEPPPHKRAILAGEVERDCQPVQGPPWVADRSDSGRGTRHDMTSLLAKFFRGLHLFLGITPPPPGHNERTFVLVWFGMLALVIGFGVFLFFLIGKMYHF